MTLFANGSQITVRTSSGATKFTSNDKLVYKRQIFTGSSFLGNGQVWRTDTPIYGLTMTGNDFPILQIRIQSSSGNMVQNLIGSQIMLNFPLPVHFEHSATQAYIDRYSYLSGAVNFRDYYWQVSFAYIDTYKKTWFAQVPGQTIYFDWRAVILSYR